MVAIIGNASVIKTDSGDVVVPNDKNANSIANKVLFAQMRTMLQEHIKKYRDKDAMMSPKELSDLAEAAKKISSGSKEVYEDKESELDKGGVVQVQEDGKTEEISFDSLTTKTNEDRPSG